MNEDHRSTRWEILELLKRSPGQTVEELSASVGITAAAVRKHLVSLEAAELLDSVLDRKPMGRPARRYRLSAASEDLFPKAYLEICAGALDYLERTVGRQAVVDFFAERAARMVQQVKPMLDGLTGEARVREFARIADKRGAMAQVTEQNGQVILQEFNCLQGQMARTYPEVCKLSEKTIEELVGVPIQRICCISSGDECCSFLISIDDVKSDGSK